MTIVIGSGDNAYTYNPSNPSDTSIPAPKSDSKSKTSNKKSDDKKSKQTFRSKFIYGGSEGVDESVKKEDYDNENIVKVITKNKISDNSESEALNFHRVIKEKN